MTHSELVLRAEKWLNKKGCHVTMREISCYTKNQENPDVIGWINSKSVLIECKASRSDFLSDKKKLFRRFPKTGMGDIRIYFCPPEIIRPEDLPEGWGLLWCLPEDIKIIANVENCSINMMKTNFKGCKDSENSMLLSALRRLQIRGYLPKIYDGLIGGEKKK